MWSFMSDFSFLNKLFENSFQFTEKWQRQYREFSYTLRSVMGVSKLLDFMYFMYFNPFQNSSLSEALIAPSLASESSLKLASCPFLMTCL